MPPRWPEGEIYFGASGTNSAPSCLSQAGRWGLLLARAVPGSHWSPSCDFSLPPRAEGGGGRPGSCGRELTPPRPSATCPKAELGGSVPCARGAAPRRAGAGLPGQSAARGNTFSEKRGEILFYLFVVFFFQPSPVKRPDPGGPGPIDPGGFSGPGAGFCLSLADAIHVLGKMLLCLGVGGWSPQGAS